MGLNEAPMFLFPSPALMLRTAVRPVVALCLALALPAQDAPNALAERAQRAMAERRFADAATAYGELAKSFPAEPALQANLGMALHLSARDQEAVAPLRRAAAAMKDSFPAHFFLGASLTRIGQFADAVPALQQATRIDPEHPFAKALLGDALEALGRFSEAADRWTELLALDRQNPYAHAGLVRCHEQLSAEAVEQLQDRDPESPHLLRLLGHSRMMASQYPSALYLFRQALERAPGVRFAHEAIAEIYDRTGHPDWAEAERRKAASLPGPDCESNDTAECMFVKGRYESLPPLTAGSSSEQTFWIARSHAALASRAFDNLRALPETVDQLQLIADVLASQQRYSPAADAYQRALEIRASDPNLERRLAELLFLARRIDEARPMLERFRSADPRDARWPAMLGRLLADEQEYDKAVPLLETALALPDPPDSVPTDLARAYLSLGKAADAVKHLQAASRRDADGSIHYQLAQAYQRLGMRNEAREALTKYRALESRSRQEAAASAALEITPPE